MSSKLEDFLKDIQLVSSERYDTISAIRKLFHQAEVPLDEDIKYGGIVFNVSGYLVGGIFSYKQHVSIEFSDGADFPDPHKVLEGGGKRRRHIKIHDPKDITEKSVDFYISESVKPYL
ncbi:DUF1801 domain-containing protein [Pleionea sp. CnH1-48]|uniref:DUF1801 domain-containing protein n=1 Tax=Pleionea sp. CnH1-48 TaxID=2954494 RepID=UPI002097EE0A|nr:DUF1801 domain-containing protein [Pleionea sp. CnH1-48]MCO7224734.1 DUF1801 domain-containing protein [Pleionea sp. CnH1-48]